METVKEQVIEAVKGLPDDVSFEQILEHMYLFEKVAGGLADLENGQTRPHELVKQRAQEWLK